MSVFGSIMSRIFGRGQAAAAQDDAQPPASAAAPRPAASDVPPPAHSLDAGAVPQQGAAAPSEPVDVEAVLTAMAANSPQKLNWRSSIVDLMKLLGLDGSFDARKQLARELGYTGDPGDSAAMNIWLHKQVMRKLAENGGRVPAELMS